MPPESPLFQIHNIVTLDRVGQTVKHSELKDSRLHMSNKRIRHKHITSVSTTIWGVPIISNGLTQTVLLVKGSIQFCAN